MNVVDGVIKEKAFNQRESVLFAGLCMQHDHDDPFQLFSVQWVTERNDAIKY